MVGKQGLAVFHPLQWLIYALQKWNTLRESDVYCESDFFWDEMRDKQVCITIVDGAQMFYRSIGDFVVDHDKIVLKMM